MIVRKYFKYDFSKIGNPGWNTESFAVIFKAVPDLLAGILIDNNSGFSVSVKEVCRKESDEKSQFCTNYFFEKDCVRIIEVSGVFWGEDEPYCIGFPLYLAGDESSEHEFAVIYDGVWFNIFCDGILFDRDSPNGGKLASLSVPVSRIENTVISGDIGRIEKEELEATFDIPVFCYTPAGFNTWAGDVVVSSFQGVFHLFYLHDRHHHTSRKGRGAHVFCHLTSRDLINWIDHGEVISFDKPYLTVGTGNSFVLDNQLYIAFGWHTERSKADEECAAHFLKEEFRTKGYVQSIAYENLNGLYPSGASCAVSSNGVDFVYSNKIIHYVENPNITVLADGTLRLCEYGIWHGNSLDKWQIIDPDFPPRLKKSPTLNTTECPSFFTLNGMEYLMIGFTGFYRREKDNSWRNTVDTGFDFYDGMAVPMAVEHEGRIIAGAWMNSPYWGSCLMLRELISLPCGAVGSRWLEETLPSGKFETLNRGNRVELPGNVVDNMFSVHGHGKVEIRFAEEEKEFFLAVDPIAGTAAWLSRIDEQPHELSEIVSKHREAESFRDLAGEPIHVWGENYTRRININADFTLRIIIHNEPKFQGAFVDVEINGNYTFATYRRDLKKVKTISFL